MALDSIRDLKSLLVVAKRYSDWRGGNGPEAPAPPFDETVIALVTLYDVMADHMAICPMTQTKPH